MPRFALIHGFGVHLTAPIVRPDLGPDGIFPCMRTKVLSEEAVVFPWGIPRHVWPWRLFDPVFVRRLYRAERRLAAQPSTLERLRIFFDDVRPELVLCHSMGCFLLKEYLMQFGLPASVVSVVFVQADLSQDEFPILSVPLHHLYCPWDITLLASTVYHRSWRTGLCPVRKEGVHSKLFPLVRPMNIHTSSIRDPKLTAFVDTLLKPSPRAYPHVVPLT